MAHELEGKLLSEELPDADLVCIVRYRARCELDGVLVQTAQMPSVNFQVTLNKAKISRGGKFIAFDSSKGDQAHGWNRRDWIVVEEVLGWKVGDKVVPVDEEMVRAA